MPVPSLESLHPIDRQIGLEQQSGGAELAPCGWLVELHLTERQADPRFFAVGTLEAGDAEEAILRYPGIVRDDERCALRPLSNEEIASLRLRTDGVRPYILRPQFDSEE